MPKPSMPAFSVHPFELPEIIFHISWYLDFPDILTCYAVSESFRRLFAPFVWQNLQFGSSMNSFFDSFKHFIYADPPTLMYQNAFREAQWVRSISIRGRSSTLPLKFGEMCNQLESITIEGMFYTYDIYEYKKKLRQFKNMLQRNRSHLYQAWNLRTLSLQGFRIQDWHLEALWTIFERLEKLELTNFWSLPVYTERQSNGDENQEPMAGTTKASSFSTLNRKARFPNLQEIVLSEWSNHDYLNLRLRHCPCLRSLNWCMEIGSGMVFPGTKLVDLFVRSTWPELDSITITGKGSSIKGIDQIRLLQSAMKPFRILDYLVSDLQPGPLELLATRHSATIQEVNLNGLEGNTKDWTIKLLICCPSLRKFQAGVVTAQDFIGAEPFVCCGLNNLSLFIDMRFPNNGTSRRFTSDELEQCRQVFRRLAGFKHLKKLDMLAPFHYEPVPPPANSLDPYDIRFSMVPLPMRLKAGLDELADLTKLTELHFWVAKHTAPMEELVWMVDHWMKLKHLAIGWWIKGGMSLVKSDMYFRNYKLIRWLNIRGISTND
ncbi:hypothetical protein BGX26_006868 [Mortierella sp. AD094]|nr:hypothetical protein BGX26_006868 [Mortierella sp. AD094]